MLTDHLRDINADAEWEYMSHLVAFLSAEELRNLVAMLKTVRDHELDSVIDNLPTRDKRAGLDLFSMVLMKEFGANSYDDDSFEAGCQTAAAALTAGIPNDAEWLVKYTSALSYDPASESRSLSLEDARKKLTDAGAITADGKVNAEGYSKMLGGVVGDTIGFLNTLSGTVFAAKLISKVGLSSSARAAAAKTLVNAGTRVAATKLGTRVLASRAGSTLVTKAAPAALRALSRIGGTRAAIALGITSVMWDTFYGSDDGA
jgi:hypothetical protein